MSEKVLEIYLHIPFCERKCAYCDFLSFPAPYDKQEAYVGKLVSEIKCAGELYSDWRVATVYIGGGTPSILPPGAIAKLLYAVKTSFVMQTDAEITMEANPGVMGPEHLQAYRKAGVNRLSMGLQSTDDWELKQLGRLHTYEGFLNCYQSVKEAGFDNVNVDLMFGLPGQTLLTWKNTLKRLALLRPEHLSVYGLSLEEGTQFHAIYTQYPHLLPGEDEERAMYWMAHDYLQEHGYERYEISNFARKGYQCRHNLGYWTDVPYLGLGLGAASYMEGCRWHNIKDLDRYLEITNIGELREDSEPLDEHAHMEEFMFLGLRLDRGVSGYEFLLKFGKNMWDVYGEAIKELEKEELVEIHSPDMRLTRKGVDVSNYVFEKFLFDKE
ncbi:MAG: radical SAM family heme chaperone HemW [Lachnospiraceae bacterium]|jgi:oxygen-independent coproporphyrinogen-3 oxidase|nr:radical SAM family heme chaperone HemW [Lachnospiraceae bacterium]